MGDNPFKLFYVFKAVGQIRLILFILVLLTGFLFDGKAQAQSLPVSCKQQQINRLHFGKNLYVRVIKYGFHDFKKLNKVAVIVPPTGGTNLIDRQYAYYFCRQGLPAIIMDEWTGSNTKFDPFDLNSHQKELDWGKKAFLTLTRYLNPAKVSVLSTSKGGIGTSCFLNEFPRNIRSLVTVVAGAPLHLTISRSNQEDLRKLRDLRMRRWQLGSVEDYDRMIYDSLKVKTSNRNPRVRLAMIIAEKDFSVPSSLQHYLANLWRPEKIWRLENNHFLTIVFSFGRLRDRIHDFMEESF